MQGVLQLQVLLCIAFLKLGVADSVPKLCLQCGVFIQLFCVAPNSDIVNLFKRDRLIGCSIYYEHSDGNIIHRDGVKLKICISGQQGAQPVFKLLITLFQRLKVIVCADNLMGVVVYAPKHIRTALLVNRSTVCQGTDVLPYHRRLIVIMLEFYPLRFGRELPQFVYQLIKVFHILTPSA